MPVGKALGIQVIPDRAIQDFRAGGSVYLLLLGNRLPEWEAWDSGSIQIGSENGTLNLYRILVLISNMIVNL